MDNTLVLRTLRDVLARLYSTEQDVSVIITDAGLDPIKIRFSSRPLTNWHFIMEEAIQQDRLDSLLAIALDDYPAHRPLEHAYMAYIRLKMQDEWAEAVLRFCSVTQATFPPIMQAIHQLEPPPADFTGREKELRELIDRLLAEGITMCGVTGLGGVGKTAFALKLAVELTNHYSEAQFYLDLQGVSNSPLAPDEVMKYIIRSCDPKAQLPDDSKILLGLYRTTLYNRKALLFFDNVRDADQVASLIPQASCFLLLTSRQKLVLPGIAVLNLDTLSLDDSEKFLLRITRRVEKYTREIASLCEGLPLALRLIGSALAVRIDIEPEDYIQSLKNVKVRLELVEASLRLSYDLLNQEQQMFWRCLAIFPDTFTRQQAGALWSQPQNLTQARLSELVSYSLVNYNPIEKTYRLHDLVRLFAESRIDGEERNLARDRLTSYYIINRARIREGFLDALAGRWKKQIFLIQAKGGMGKTWLLNELMLECNHQTPEIISIYIDFYHTINNDLYGLLSSISSELGQTHFPTMNAALSAWYTASESQTADVATVEKARSTANKAFFYELRKLIATRPVVFFFDTCERFNVWNNLLELDQSNKVKDWIERDLLAQICADELPGIFVVLAGRWVPTLMPEYTDYFVQPNLNELNQNEISSYLRTVHGYSGEHTDLLAQISKGNPTILKMLVNGLIQGKLDVEQLVNFPKDADPEKVLGVVMEALFAHEYYEHYKKKMNLQLQYLRQLGSK